jgi:hypothetical protein
MRCREKHVSDHQGPLNYAPCRPKAAWRLSRNTIQILVFLAIIGAVGAFMLSRNMARSGRIAEGVRCMSAVRQATLGDPRFQQIEMTNMHGGDDGGFEIGGLVATPQDLQSL